jgi:hypothetical protein
MNLDPGATFDDGYMLDIDTSNILGEAFLPLDSLSGFGNVEMDCDNVFLSGSSTNSLSSSVSSSNSSSSVHALPVE